MVHTVEALPYWPNMGSKLSFNPGFWVRLFARGMRRSFPEKILEASHYCNKSITALIVRVNKSTQRNPCLVKKGKQNNKETDMSICKARPETSPDLVTEGHFLKCSAIDREYYIFTCPRNFITSIRTEESKLVEENLVRNSSISFTRAFLLTVEPRYPGPSYSV